MKELTIDTDREE